MSLPGLTPRHRATLALVVAVCLAVAGGISGPWQSCPDSPAAAETTPQLAAPGHPLSPIVADGTRKSSAETLNLLPKSALLSPPQRLHPGAGDRLPLPSLAAAIPASSFRAATPIRAPPSRA